MTLVKLFTPNNCLRFLILANLGVIKFNWNQSLNLFDADILLVND